MNWATLAAPLGAALYGEDHSLEGPFCASAQLWASAKGWCGFTRHLRVPSGNRARFHITLGVQGLVLAQRLLDRYADGLSAPFTTLFILRSTMTSLFTTLVTLLPCYWREEVSSTRVLV